MPAGKKKLSVPLAFGGNQELWEEKKSLLFFQNESLRSPIPGVSVPYLRLPPPCLAMLELAVTIPRPALPFRGHSFLERPGSGVLALLESSWPVEARLPHIAS